MMLILLLIQLTSACVFTYLGKRNQLTEKCMMQAVRGYLNTVVGISSVIREAFRVKAKNCTAHLRPFMAGSRPLVQFGICKQDENAPTVILCLSKHIDHEWRLHASCKVD